MLSDVTKIFGKEFLIGYFLPALYANAVLSIVLHRLELLDNDLLGVNLDDPPKIVLAVLVVFGAALILLVLSRPTIRLLEGYGSFNPLRLRLRVNARWINPVVDFRRLNRLEWIRIRLNRRARRGQTKLEESISKRKRPPALGQIQYRLASRFPGREDLVLPTAFGNTVRAFEDYSRVTYGFESIEGWNRLTLILPELASKGVQDKKSLVDFWCNIWIISLTALLAIGAHWAYCGCNDLPVLTGVLAAVTLLSPYGARMAAFEWGVAIKSCFDLYLHELAAKLGYELPGLGQEQRTFWQKFSQTFLHRKDYLLGRLDQYRKK